MLSTFISLEVQSSSNISQISMIQWQIDEKHIGKLT